MMEDLFTLEVFFCYGWLIVPSIQVFILFNWNEDDGALNGINQFVAQRLKYRLLYKPIIECLLCQSLWLSVLSGLCLFLSYGIFEFLLFVPVYWILTIGAYRVITE